MENNLINNIERERIIELLNYYNGDKRIKHILGVEECALELSKKYGENKEKVITAALFHDLAKAFSLEKSHNILSKYNIGYDDIEAESVELLHSKVAFAIAKYEFKIDDEDVLNAIKYHTTGRENMTLLEKIIFVADAIEKNRVYPNVDKFRELAFIDLDIAILEIIDNTLNYLILKKQIIHINTLKCRNYILMNTRR